MKEVFEAMEGDDAETNENGEVELHGNTFLAWTTAIPGAPLRNGGCSVLMGTVPYVT